MNTVKLADFDVKEQLGLEVQQDLVVDKGTERLTAPPFYLGHGYRSYDRSLSNRIIDHGKLGDIGKPQDARVESDFGVVVSQEDFEKAFSADASISGSAGAFSASAKASFRSQYNRNQTSVTLAFTKKVITGIFRYADYPITQQARREARDVSRFARSYGNRLVTGVGVGGACCYMFRFDFRSESEATEFKASIKARYGTGSGDASTETKTKLQNIKAATFFSGYTTGTLDVPNLFPSEISEGTKFLFSKGFSDYMIAGLLRYFDEFTSHFKVGDSAFGYSQSEMEFTSLSVLPDILPNQDKISSLGAKMDEVSQNLSRQLDYLSALDKQAAYVSNVKDVNLPDAETRATSIRRSIAELVPTIERRLQALLGQSDVKSKYDFTAEFPDLDADLCTADPRVVVVKYDNRSTRGRWTSYKFAIRKEDLDLVCWVEATCNICAVRHRPNGGRLTVRLVKSPIASSAVGYDGSVFGEDFRTGSDIVEEKSVLISRGQTASLRVGGFAFKPNDVGHVYSVDVYTDGDYGCESNAWVTTKTGRQLPILL